MAVVVARGGARRRRADGLDRRARGAVQARARRSLRRRDPAHAGGEDPPPAAAGISRRTCRSRAPPSGPARPSAIICSIRSGTSAPIVRPIAADTSSPTRSSSASGPSGWPAPSRMQVSIASGSSPVRSISRTASNRNGNSRRLTTKPAVSGTSTAVLPSASHSAYARARVAVRGRGREGELDQVHLRDRVEDVQPDEAVGPAGRVGELGRPTATRSSSRGSRRRAAARRARRPARALAAVSSTIASTTKLAAARSALSQVTCTLPLTFAPAFSHSSRDAAVGLVRGPVGARPYDHRSALRGYGRQPARDGSASGDSDSFGQGGSSVG